jgi:8-oxo-dGTP diphosphatase
VTTLSKTILAAGGIVLRSGTRKFAVVQRSKDRLWVLPRGKLRRTERPVRGALREVVEETGCRVKVSEFLGAITYLAGGRPKAVQFWLMQAAARQSYEVTKDIVKVEWLSLAAAVKRLSHPLERLFLANVGRYALLQHKRRKRRKAKSTVSKAGRRSTRRTAK